MIVRADQASGVGNLPLLARTKPRRRSRNEKGARDRPIVAGRPRTEIEGASPVSVSAA
jgi:hypothetical protein